MIFGAIFAPVQGQLNQGWKYAVLSTFSELSFESGFRYPFENKDRQLFLWYLELFWPSLNVSQTKVENMHICQLSRNWHLKVDLDTHLRDKHGNLFLWDLELFWPSFKVGIKEGWKGALLSTFSELSFESGFGYLVER